MSGRLNAASAAGQRLHRCLRQCLRAALRPWLRLPALCAAALLSGCAAGGPLSVPVGAAPSVPADRTLAAADGSRIAATGWGPERPAAVILALHGFGDHGQSTFSDAARFWARRGIATIAIDQRGFGHNASRGRWPGEAGLIADAIVVSRQVRARYPCAPLAVLGHSMGGGIVLAAASRGLDADGIVLAAPAIWGGEQMNPLHRALAWTAAAVVPDKRFSGRGVVKIQASDNLDALRAMRDDPLYLGRPSSRELLGLVRVTDEAAAAARRVDRPAMLLLGIKDQIVPRDRVLKVFDTLRGPRTVVEYPEGWHLLFRDLQAENVFRDVANWALAQDGPDCADGRPAPRAIRIDSPPAPRPRNRRL